MVTKEKVSHGIEHVRRVYVMQYTLEALLLRIWVVSGSSSNDGIVGYATPMLKLPVPDCGPRDGGSLQWPHVSVFVLLCTSCEVCHNGCLWRHTPALVVARI